MCLWVPMLGCMWGYGWHVHFLVVMSGTVRPGADAACAAPHYSCGCLQESVLGMQLAWHSSYYECLCWGACGLQHLVVVIFVCGSLCWGLGCMQGGASMVQCSVPHPCGCKV